MSTQADFEDAVRRSRSLPKPSNENLLRLYALYKQATEGDVQGEKPGNPFDIVGNSKFSAWESLKGLSKEDAMQQYINLVNSL